MQYDVAVIGAGVVGAMITRELSKLDMNLVLLEKAGDVAMGSSKANSAIVHAGFDAETGSGCFRSISCLAYFRCGSGVS